MSKLIPLTNSDRLVIVDDENYDCLMQWTWHLNDRYVGRYSGSSRNRTRKFIPMHRVIIDAPENCDVDHSNHDRFDNRKSNLRVCTRQENSRNRIKHRGKSQYKGVTWDDKGKGKGKPKWRATIVINRKTFRLGRFDSEIDAAHAYDAAAREYFGEFAHLNFPDADPSTVRFAEIRRVLEMK